MAGARVLVVDDEKNITTVIQAMLQKAGFDPIVFNDSGEAVEALETPETTDAGEIQAIITDLYMPGPSGMEILKHCQKFHPEIPVVIITAYGTVEAAVSALKQGAFDFITKPQRREQSSPNLSSKIERAERNCSRTGSVTSDFFNGGQ
jgi:DNA-binding NtrC family response regulator